MYSWPYLTKCCQTALKNSIIINIKVIVVSSTNTVNIDIVRSQIDLLSLSLCIVNINPYPFSDLSLKITKQQHILQLQCGPHSETLGLAVQSSYQTQNIYKHLYNGTSRIKIQSDRLKHQLVRPLDSVASSSSTCVRYCIHIDVQDFKCVIVRLSDGWPYT